MFNYLLAETAGEPAENTGLFGGENWIMWVIIGVVLVLMVVMTIIPQRKRKKEQETMMNNIQVGAKIMTIGRMVGRITQVNADNTLIVNVGTEQSPTLIVIDRQAVGLVLEAVTPVAAPAPAVEDAPQEDASDAIEGEVAEEAVVEEAVAEETVVDEAVVEETVVEETVAEEAPAEEVEKPKKASKKSKK